MSIFSTPSSVDGFSRYWARYFNENEVIGVVTGFLAMFSRRRPVIRTDANSVDIDIVRGNERTAQLIMRGTVGEYLSNNGVSVGKYTNYSRRFPLSEDVYDLTQEQIGNRMAGENPFEERMRLERMRDTGQMAYYRMVERTIRLWERTAAQSALTGTQPSILGTSDANLILDYDRNPDLIETFLLGEQFDNAAVNPLDVIDSKINKLIQIGRTGRQSMGGQYVVLMGIEAIAGFFNNENVKEAGDNRRIMTVEKNPELTAPSQIRDTIAGGMSYIAKGYTSQGKIIHIMTYDSIYDDENDDPQYYMPTKSMLITPLTFRTDRYFGPPDTLPLTSLDRTWMRETFGITPNSQIPARKMAANPGIIVPEAFYVDAYAGGARKNATLRLQSAPIFATTQTDALFTGNSVVS